MLLFIFLVFLRICHHIPMSHCVPLTLKVPTLCTTDCALCTLMRLMTGESEALYQRPDLTGDRDTRGAERPALWPWAETSASSIGGWGLCEHQAAAIIGQTLSFSRLSIPHYFEGMVGITLILVVLSHLDYNTHYIMVMMKKIIYSSSSILLFFRLR